MEFRSSMGEAHLLRRESWVLRLWRIVGRWGFSDRLAEFRRTGILLLEREPLAAEWGAAARPG